jgi:hypothetical protein
LGIFEWDRQFRLSKRLGFEPARPEKYKAKGKVQKAKGKV